MQVKNFEIYRGDQRTITWQVTEDFTGKTLLFGVKASKLLDAIRLIEITPVYNNGMITVIINAVDTENILQQRLYYDLINVTDNTTIATGTLYLIADVITKVDGYAQGKIDDNLISNLSVWSSEKTNNEIQTEANLRTTADANLQSQVTTLQASSHTHTNKTLLDTYNQTNADLSDAVAKKHNHANQTILDNTSESFTTTLKSNYDNHLANINNPHAVNAAQVGLGNVTNDAQLKRASGDFNSFVEQTTINDNDIYLIEDSINGYVKKKTTNASIIKSTRIIKATETPPTLTGNDIALVNNASKAAIKDSTTTRNIAFLDMPNDTFSDTTWILKKGGFPFIHNFNYGNNGTVTTAGNNTFVGINSGNFTMGATAINPWDSSNNIGIGVHTLNSNTTGSSNVVIGSYSCNSNTTGYWNTAIGSASMVNNTMGSANTAVGVNSLYHNTTGSNSIAVGSDSGSYIADGSTANQTSNASLYLGANTKALADGGSNEIVIGYNATGNGSNSVTLGNDSITKTILKGNVAIGTTIANELLQLGDISNYIDRRRALFFGAGGYGAPADFMMSSYGDKIILYDNKIDYSAKIGIDESGSIWLQSLNKSPITQNGSIKFYTGQDVTTPISNLTMIITGSRCVGVNTPIPTATVDINSTTGYNQLRLRTSYTPTSTADANGNVGDISWDDNYLYAKTTAGWKRSALSTF